MEKRPGLVLSLCLALLGYPARLAAQPAPGGPSEAALEAAKDFFRKGNAEMDAGNYERALDYFLQSRAQVASIANTNNAALALEKLGRLEEALELYETLLSTFATQLKSEERTAISEKVATLRGQIGTLEVSANVDGTLVIDGRKRGTVPLTAPLRLLPGAHVVRVIKDGYTPAEATIVVNPGQKAQVDLRLEALSAVGRLRVTDSSGTAGVEVLIDGAPVGATPWEGSLGPGRHLVALRGKDVGTSPAAINVLVGQTVKAELKAVRLGPPLNVVFEPISTRVSIDGVDVGAGPWRGRLPAGEHTFEGHEEGYLSATVQVGVTQNSATISLKLDENHPRWQRTATGKWHLGLVLAGATGGDLGSRAESQCNNSCGDAASGGFFAGQLAYRLPNHLIFDLTAGILEVKRDITRSSIQDTATYNLNDQLRLQGLMAQLGVGYEFVLTKRWSFVGRVGVGFLSTRVSDKISGTVSQGTQSASVVVDKSGSPSRGATLLLAPSLSAEVKITRKLHLGLGLGAVVSLLDGPELDHGEVGPTSGCTASNAVACLKGNSLTVKERAYSRFLLWTPQISLGTDFLGTSMNKTTATRKQRSALLALWALLPLSWASPADALEWQLPTDTLSEGIFAPALVPLPDGRTFVVGGLTGTAASPTPVASAYLIDPSSATMVKQTKPMSAARYGHVATLLPGGKILVAGGLTSFNGTQALDSAEVYDPSTDTWAVIETMGAARAFATATTLPSGKVLLLGGSSGNGATLDSAESFDPFAKDGAGKWNGLAPMKINNESLGRYAHSTTLLNDGRLLVAGGARNGSATQDTLLLDLNAPSGQPWSKAANLGQARAGHAAVRMRSGQVMLLGGCSNLPSFEIGGAGCTVENGVRFYTPTANSWGVLSGPGPSSLGGRSYFALQNGWVMVAGGRDAGGAATKSVSFFKVNDATAMDPGTVSLPVTSNWGWSEEDSSSPLTLKIFRAFSGYTIDQKGRILMVGGIKEGVAQATFEYLDYLENGTICPGSQGSPLECASGVCSDGVCCDKRCDSTCDSCLAAQTNLGKDGICGAATSEEGAVGCKLTNASCTPNNQIDVGKCSGGVCVESVQDCGYFKCNDKQLCPTTCNTSNDCISGNPPLLCTPSGGSKICSRELPDGDTCNAPEDCKSKHCENQIDASTTNPKPPLVCCSEGCNEDTCDGGKTGVIRYYCDSNSDFKCQSTTENCNGYVCSGKACLQSCNKLEDCADTHFCSNAKCELRKDLGAPCTIDSECQSTVCADGVCCNDAECKTNGCKSCKGALTGSPSDGTCLPITGGKDPKDFCENEQENNPESCGKTGSCNGKGACEMASGNACKPPTCVGSTRTAFLCNGSGVCESGSQTCADNLMCNQDSPTCKTACTQDDDCQGNFACLKDSNTCPSACEKKADCKDKYNCNTVNHLCEQTATCVDDAHYLDQDGIQRDCRPNHRCNDDTPGGAANCAQQCRSSLDCVAGFVCDAAGECRDPFVAAADPGDCFCSQPGRPASSSPAAALALLGLALSALRRRSSRACS